MNEIKVFRLASIKHQLLLNIIWKLVAILFNTFFLEIKNGEFLPLIFDLSAFIIFVYKYLRLLVLFTSIFYFFSSLINLSIKYKLVI